jgi:hypothetical protein
MNAALTTPIPTRAIAGVVMVPRGHRMSWLVSKDYPFKGEQEERS